MFRIPYKLLLLGPTLMMALGLTMNASVVAANHHKMPVLVNSCPESSLVWAESDDSIHTCMTENSRLKFLADWYYIPGLGTASPGDFFEWGSEQLLYPGFILWAALMILEVNKREVA